MTALLSWCYRVQGGEIELHIANAFLYTPKHRKRQIISERKVKKKQQQQQTTGFSIRTGSRWNSPAIPHELTAYLIEKLPHILQLT